MFATSHLNVSILNSVPFLQYVVVFAIFTKTLINLKNYETVETLIFASPFPGASL